MSGCWTCRLNSQAQRDSTSEERFFPTPNSPVKASTSPLAGYGSGVLQKPRYSLRSPIQETENRDSVQEKNEKGCLRWKILHLPRKRFGEGMGDGGNEIAGDQTRFPHGFSRQSPASPCRYTPVLAASQGFKP